jgi:hypothetical protein
VAAIGLAATAPAVAAAAPGWTPYPGFAPAEIHGDAHLEGVEIDRDGAARVHATIEDRSGQGRPPRPIVSRRSADGGWGMHENAPPPAGLGPAARARVVDGRIVVALRRADGTYGPGQAVAPAGPEPPGGGSPRAAVSENGDAVVAWSRRPGGSPERLVAATKQAGRPWSPTRVLAQGTIGSWAVAVDLRGTAVAMWAQGDLRRRPGAPPLQRIRVAERELGAQGWSAARTLGMGHGSGFGLETDGAGTVHALWGRSLGRPMLMARREPGVAWRVTGAVPRSGCCLVLMRVSPLGDTFVVDPWLGADGRVWHQPAGAARWSAFPDGDDVPAIDSVGGISLDLEVNAAGDAVLGWSTGESNSSMPLRAAYYEAPARPALTSFVARPAGKRVRLEAELSARGRVLVQVRRDGSPRILDGFIVTARAGRSTLAVPARVRKLLAAPGRYVLTADTGGRDAAASTRSAAITTP